MTLDLLRELMRHMEWADALVWSAIAREPDAVADTTLLDRMLHIHAVQQAFLHVWKGESPAFPDRSQLREAGSIRRWARDYYPQAHHFLDSLDIQRLAASVVMPWADPMMETLTGRPASGVPTLAETILQITAHSTYHRGQVNLQLRQLNIEPPLTDFIAWIWLGRPEPGWPSATLRPA